MCAEVRLAHEMTARESSLTIMYIKYVIYGVGTSL